MVRGKKNTEDKDNRMIADYFKELNNYIKNMERKQFYYGNVDLFMKFIAFKTPILVNVL